MTTETISRTNPAWVTDEDITAETINRTHKTTATAETINRTGPGWETDEEIFPKDPKSYMGLIFARDWQTHLPPSPEGQMLASADYCPESGDIAHFILDPKSREIIIACFDSCFNEPDELRYFLLQENGLMAPVTKAESRKALDRLNANAKIEWSYPPSTKGQPKRNDTGPWDPTSPPILAICSTTTSGAPTPAGSSTRMSSHRISVWDARPGCIPPAGTSPSPGPGQGSPA